MRTTLALTATLLTLAWVAPASAQMCGSAPAAGSTASTSASGGMCGMMRPAATDPMAVPNTPAQAQAPGGCSCCREMAMMQDGTGGMMNGQQPDQPLEPPAPATPSMPDGEMTPNP